MTYDRQRGDGIVNTEESMDEKMPKIAIIGIGGGGSRILSDGIDKILTYKTVDRYSCLIRAVRAESQRPLCYIVDTSSDPTRKGFYDNIPADQKISLSLSVKGMSRGAGGRPGRAAKAMLNDDVVKNLAETLYKPIAEQPPAIVVIIHTADGGTGGGLTPEVLQHLGYALPMSTIFWVFTVLPKRNPLSLQGPRTVAPTMGKLLQVTRRISDRNFSNIPFSNREIINSAIARREADQSYEFSHSRIALFPLSNHHFAQCGKEFGRKEIREEVLNPFPIELLSQALYPFLKYTVTTPEEQAWMQENWPLGPIDIPDIMAGLTPERPYVIPHLWVDPKVWDEAETQRVINNFTQGVIELERSKEGEGEDDLGLFSFTGSSAQLYDLRATSLYCIPIYPEGSEYFEDFGDFVSDEWFPRLSSVLNFISGPNGLKVGVISHAANLKPQPIPKPPGENTLGFDNGMLVTLIFGAIPLDMPIWLESTRTVISGYLTEDNWEISAYDALDLLRVLSDYMGWSNWPDEKYIEI